MACACKGLGRAAECAWCKEAKAQGLPPWRHNCQWGTCS